MTTTERRLRRLAPIGASIAFLRIAPAPRKPSSAIVTGEPVRVHGRGQPWGVPVRLPDGREGFASFSDILRARNKDATKG